MVELSHGRTSVDRTPGATISGNPANVVALGVCAWPHSRYVRTGPTREDVREPVLAELPHRVEHRAVHHHRRVVQADQQWPVDRRRGYDAGQPIAGDVGEIATGRARHRGVTQRQVRAAEPAQFG